jgi:hypothetical protein
MSESQHLDSHQRDTLLQVFQHPTGHNIEWHDVLTLLEGVGTVERNGDLYLVRVGSESQVLRRPPHKDVDVQQIADLRRILTSAGYDALVAELEAKGKEA